MKIRINSPEPPYTHGYSIIYDGNKKLYNFNTRTSFFNEAEIQYILGDTNYRKFGNGTYEFDIPKWKLNAVSDNLNPFNSKIQWNIFMVGYREL